jgi:hypothetical protein
MTILKTKPASPGVATPTRWNKALRTESASKAAAPVQPKATHDDRDDAAGLADGVRPSESMRQGAIDVERGVKDTSRAPEADRAYKRLKP